jgi:ankyrin repeat protein
MDKGTKRGRKRSRSRSKSGSTGSGTRKTSRSSSSEHKLKRSKVDVDINQFLINACFNNQDEVAIQLLLQGANANYIDQTTGYTPLLIACEINNIKLVEFLIGMGANVNLQGFQGGPFPLDLSQGDVKKLLLNRGAIGTIAEPEREKTPLVDVKEYFDPLKDKTPDSRFARLSIRIRNRANKHNEREYAIATLINIIDMRRENPKQYKKTPFIDVNKLNKFGNTLLEEACSRGKVKIVILLLQAGADVNKKNDSDGFTPLGTAVVQSTQMNPSTTIEIIRELLNAGADVNMKYGENNSIPLITACYDGNFDVVKILLSSPNKNVNLIDDNGDTPLTAAIESTMKNENPVSCNDAIKIIKLLIHSGADVNLKNSEGESPTIIAGKNESCPELEKVLANYGAQFSMGPPRSRS